MHSFSRLIIFIGLLLLFSALAGLCGVWFAEFMVGEAFTIAPGVPVPSTRPGWIYTNITMAISQIGGFGGAVWTYVRFFGNASSPHSARADLQLRLPSKANVSPAIRAAAPWIFTILATLSFAPLLVLSFDLNALLIPEGSALDQFARPLEDFLEQLTVFMLNVDTPLDRIAVVLLMAGLPALFEELAFRGVLQPLLIRLTGRPWIGIMATALLFSFIHFQFYGFLPRVFLGLLFGWIVYRTGSLWPAVLAHFTNNTAAVLGSWATGSIEGSDVEPFSLLGLALAAIFTASIIALHRLYNRPTDPQIAPH
jgi:membrane protease YdiL (CAAX protease family)